MIEMTIPIRVFTAPEVRGHAAEFAGLLCDAVNGGAAVGFLPPLDDGAARRYWESVASAIEGGYRVVLAAERGGAVIGSVQLELARMPNGRHRAEVMKVLVHSGERGRGIGAALMRAAEQEASARGRTLLVLDTRRGDHGERLYRRLGYVEAGVIPDYAESAGGGLHDTVIFYKKVASGE
jgi:ribosomal protein S18 acetylase RimI-like enzyme